MNNDEVTRVQTYLRGLFNNENMILKRSVRDDMVEVLLNDEFIATITRDDDEGEISYNFSMAILDFDLPEA